MKKLLKIGSITLAIIQFTLFGTMIQKWDMQAKYNMTMFGLPRYPEKFEVMMAGIMLAAGVMFIVLAMEIKND